MHHRRSGVERREAVAVAVIDEMRNLTGWPQYTSE